MTCLNPWQGLGAPNIDPGGPKNSKTWPKMLQNDSKSSFVGPGPSKMLKLPGKKLNRGVSPRISSGGPKICQKWPKKLFCGTPKQPNVNKIEI